eukprot:6529918-Alexandrium_andersonii.AAC.1
MAPATCGPPTGLRSSRCSRRFRALAAFLRACLSADPPLDLEDRSLAPSRAGGLKWLRWMGGR